MFGVLVFALLLLRPTIQHFIIPTEQCAKANECNHTWKSECGQEKVNADKRLFMDLCDMFEYNCDLKKEYQRVELDQCPKNETTTSSTESTTVTTTTAGTTTVTNANTTIESTIATTESTNSTIESTTSSIESTTIPTTVTESTTIPTTTVPTILPLLLPSGACTCGMTATTIVSSSTATTPITITTIATTLQSSTTTESTTVSTSTEPTTVSSTTENSTISTPPTSTEATTVANDTNCTRISTRRPEMLNNINNTGITNAVDATVCKFETVSTTLSTTVKSCAYPKDCERPVTWETTPETETRDFYQILKERYGDAVKLLKATTHWPKRRRMYRKNYSNMFIFGRHSESRIDR